MDEMEKENLRELRTKLGYAPEGMASLLGISVSELTAYENDPGSLPIEAACKICFVYRKELDAVSFGGR